MWKLRYSKKKVNLSEVLGKGWKGFAGSCEKCNKLLSSWYSFTLQDCWPRMDPYWKKREWLIWILEVFEWLGSFFHAKVLHLCRHLLAQMSAPSCRKVTIIKLLQSKLCCSSLLFIFFQSLQILYLLCVIC